MKPTTAGTVLVAPPLALAGVLVLTEGDSIPDKFRNGRKLITDSGEDLSSWYFLASSFLESHRQKITDIYGKEAKDFRNKFEKHKQYCRDAFRNKITEENSAEFLQAFNLCTRPK